MLPATVIIGAQWGDEGKGKIVDYLAEEADIIIRYNGGNNAGHTLIVQGIKHILHLIPSGILHEGKISILGDGMVIDPEALLDEMQILTRAGIQFTPDNLLISNKAHLVLPYHRLLDQLQDQQAGGIGTTGRGIGPAYEDKAARRGIRAGDLLRTSSLKSRVSIALSEANARIERMSGKPFDAEGLFTSLVEQAKQLAPYIKDTHQYLMQEFNASQKRILFEGAQGVMLDIDHGTYPYVTSSQAIPGGVLGGAGIPHQWLNTVVGVAKAYTTRVGGGPFPTEMNDEDAAQLRHKGAEFGATTGRPRRCGWLDLPALRYAVQLSGISHLALTKLDVLSGMKPLMVCEAYEHKGQRIDYFPSLAEELYEIKPILREMHHFDEDISHISSRGRLPTAVKNYLDLIQEQLGIPISLVSLGAERHQTIRT